MRTPLNANSVIYVDVDDTLVRSFGPKQIPILGTVDFVRKMHRAGHTLYCWSRGGGEYAKQVAETLGVDDCFTGFLPKPDVIVDDQQTNCLGHCEFIHPNNAD